MEMAETVKVTVARPTVGSAGKTGTWGVFAPEIDRARCNDCQLCYLYCPEACITADIQIDLEYCKGCGICARECPRKAIKMSKKWGTS